VIRFGATVREATFEEVAADAPRRVRKYYAVSEDLFSREKDQCFSLTSYLSVGRLVSWVWPRLIQRPESSTRLRN